MKDDIYSLCQLLQPNHRSGTSAKIAVFTENGAIVMTSESCQSLIQEAIRQGSQTHVADQIGGIYVLRNAPTTLAKMSTSHQEVPSSHSHLNLSTSMKNTSMKNSELDNLYTGYTRHGLS